MDEGLVLLLDSSHCLADWWNNSLTDISRELKTKRASIMIYTVWNIWKERNRRVFERKTVTPRRILQLIKDELATRLAVCEGLEVSLSINVIEFREPIDHHIIL